MATTHSDTSVNSLVINKLTKAQYDALETKSETELYLVPDEIDNAPTSGSDNPVKSGGVYNALQGKQDVIDSSHKLSADLVDDSNTTNKFTNATEKQTWNNKQDALTFNTTPSSSNKVATMADVPTTMGASGSGHKGGLVPDTPSTAGTTKFLREDGTWEVPAGGGGSAYVPTLNAAPTSSTTTYTKDGQTVDFEVGQFARVANQDNPTGYDMWQLYDLFTENNVTTAAWRSMDSVIGDINTILDNINGEVV